MSNNHPTPVPAPDDAHQIIRQIRDGWLAALCAFGGVVDHDPFLLTFDSSSDLVWVNYATPAREASDPEFDRMLPRLREAFAQRRRTLRFEFFECLHPTLGAILSEHGVVPQLRMPAMVCTRAELRQLEQLPGFSVDLLTAQSRDDELADFIRTRDEGFGPMSPQPIEVQVATMRRELASGSIRSALVRVDGTPAGTGTLMGRGRVCELGGVTTVPAFRGRGVARLVSHFLAAMHLADPAAEAVWLTAGSDLAQRVYDHIGFRVIGWQSVYIDQHALTKS